MKKKLVVAVLTAAVATTSMFGTVHAGSRVSVAAAGGGSWSGVFVKGSASKHKKGTQSAVTVKETTEANVKCSNEFKMKSYAEALHKEANKQGYKYNVKQTFKSGYSMLVKSGAETGTYKILYEVLGNPIVGCVEPDEGKTSIEQIYWIGIDRKNCKTWKVCKSI